MERNIKKIVLLLCFIYNKLLKGLFNEFFLKVFVNIEICLMISMYCFIIYVWVLIKGLKSFSFCFLWLVCLDK